MLLDERIGPDDVRWGLRGHHASREKSVIALKIL
jgi:hypothetical protein